MTSIAAAPPLSTIPDYLKGAGAGLVAGAAVGSVGTWAVMGWGKEGTAALGLGLVAGGVGGAIAGAAAGQWGTLAGVGIAVAVPVIGVGVGLRMGASGMYGLGAMLLGIPFAIGGLAGTAAAAAVTP